MPAIGLTDHHTLTTGAIEFPHACEEAEIQLILGLEIDLALGRLPLLASNLMISVLVTLIASVLIIFGTIKLYENERIIIG
jgi:DNA polymerase III alpha subunit